MTFGLHLALFTGVVVLLFSLFLVSIGGDEKPKPEIVVCSEAVARIAKPITYDPGRKGLHPVWLKVLKDFLDEHGSQALGRARSRWESVIDPGTAQRHRDMSTRKGIDMDDLGSALKEMYGPDVESTE